tara:strand:- start:319 stop:1326 length:1008 start_codon:yes stop_codon:yes gene_type:complete
LRPEEEIMTEIIVVDGVDGLEKDVSFEDVLAMLKESGTRGEKALWVDFQAATEEQVAQLADVIPIHDITRRDIFSDRVREKWGDYDEYLFVVGHGLNFNSGKELLDTISVSFLVYPRVLISFHKEELRSRGVVLERIEREARGVLPDEDWAFYAYLDALTDLYMDVVDHCADEIDAIDSAVLTSDAGSDLLARMSAARRNLANLRRRLLPKREFLQSLSYQDQSMISRETQIRLRNVLDHVIRMGELVDMGRDTLAGAQSNYIAQVSNRMNAVMKTLSIVATIMLPMTLVAGLFGMNVQVPGQNLDGQMWFWSLLAAMFVSGVLMIVVFRKRNWL